MNDKRKQRERERWWARIEKNDERKEERRRWSNFGSRLFDSNAERVVHESSSLRWRTHLQGLHIHDFWTWDCDMTWDTMSIIIFIIIQVLRIGLLLIDKGISRKRYIHMYKAIYDEVQTYVCPIIPALPDSIFNSKSKIQPPLHISYLVAHCQFYKCRWTPATNSTDVYNKPRNRIFIHSHSQVKRASILNPSIKSWMYIHT